MEQTALILMLLAPMLGSITNGLLRSKSAKLSGTITGPTTFTLNAGLQAGMLAERNSYVGMVHAEFSCMITGHTRFTPNAGPQTIMMVEPNSHVVIISRCVLHVHIFTGGLTRMLV